jgi:GT2 family glycosyltransferase
MESGAGIFAVVYSYNRKALAVQCLASIFRQAVAPERIVFVDNGSTDGTRAYLAETGLLADSRIDYVRLEQNTGASGGLSTGIRRAWELGCSFAWVMDDDVVCETSTLAELKRAWDENFAAGGEAGFLVSSLVDPEGRANNVPQVDDRASPDRCPEWSDLLARGLVRVRISTLTSILLPRATLDRVGLPRRDFFLWGEDTDYTLRITNWRPGYLVGSSRAVHLRATSGFLDIFNETDPARVRNFYYLYRNTTYLRRTYWPARGLLLFLGKALLHLGRALRGDRHRWVRARAIAGGTLAGLFFEPRPEPLVPEGQTAPLAQEATPVFS